MMGITPYAKNASGLKHAVGRKGAHPADGRTACFMTHIRICFCAAGAFMKSMLEKEIERRMVQTVKDRGGLCYKFVSPNNPGVPDRIIITPDGRVVFVELKTEIGRLARIQKWQISEMQKRGADVRVAKGWPAVKALLEEVIPVGVQAT